MKKTVIILIAIAVVVLACVLVGCRAASQVPGVTAIQSMLPSLPSASPSAAAPTAVTMTPGATIPMVTTPAGGASAAKPSMPAKTTMPKASAKK